jgi:hypothetical protein
MEFRFINSLVSTLLLVGNSDEEQRSFKKFRLTKLLQSGNDPDLYSEVPGSNVGHVIVDLTEGSSCVTTESCSRICLFFLICNFVKLILLHSLSLLLFSIVKIGLQQFS